MESIRLPPRESIRIGETNITCEEHPHETITNFCFASLRALCPACIDYHNKMMKQNNMFPEIDTIRNVKINCVKKCQTAIAALQAELASLESQIILNPKAMIENGIYEIRRARDKLIAFINKYVESLELEYERSITEAVAKASNYSDVGDKIQSLIRELEHLMYNVDTPSCVPTVKKICMIDLKALLEKFKADVRHTITVRENLASNFAEISVDEHLFSEVTENIQRYLSLGRREIKRLEKSNFEQNYPFDSQIQDDSGFIQFHREYHNDSSEQFPVTMPDYFEPGAQKRYLHFFQNHENRFHFINLNGLSRTSRPEFEAIELNIDFRIPPFHKSIAIPNGDIYLIGGSDDQDSSRKLSTTYLFDWSSHKLIPRANLTVPRSSFAVCYMNKHIYVAGGLTNNSTFTRRCEKFDIASNRWTQIADLNYDVLAPCMTSFNDRYIFKFGGYNQGNYLEPLVEKYDPAKNTWLICRVRIELPNTIKPEYFKILSTSACVQINLREIYVFGGYLEDNSSSNQTFIFRLNQEEEDNNTQNYTITKIGLKSLTHPEAFWNNNPIVLNKQIYALQNVQTIDQEDVCLDDRRRLICFDSYDWFSLA